MSEASWEALQKADDAFLEDMYLPRRRRLGPLRLAWHPDLGDVEWNRVRVLRPSSDNLHSWLLRGLKEVEEAPGRLSPARACVEVGPGDAPQLESRLRTWRFEPVFEHRWLVLPLATKGDQVEAVESSTVELPALDIRSAAPHHSEDFVALFHQGFSSDDRGDLGSGWDRALRHMLQSSISEREGDPCRSRLAHWVAYLGPEAVGIASLGILGDLTGLYNLAVPPRFRSRGIASALMRSRLRTARQLGARTAFLQTDDEAVFSWHRRRGYPPGPVVRGWAPRES